MRGLGGVSRGHQGGKVPGGGRRAEGLGRPRPAGPESSWPPRRGRSSSEPGGAAAGGASAQARPFGSPDGGAEVRTLSGRSRRADAGDSAPAWEPERSWGREVVKRRRREMSGGRREAEAPPPRHRGLGVPPLPLASPALPCLPALRPGLAPPAPSELSPGPLGRGDAGCQLGAVSERSGLDAARDGQRGLWPRGPLFQRFPHPPGMTVSQSPGLPFRLPCILRPPLPSAHPASDKTGLG